MARTSGKVRCRRRTRFASSPLKNGHDPLRLYQTLTHGYGFMVAQRWMVPQQKYDVIHYIREAYLKERNDALYTPVNEAYLASLPVGDTWGPEPVRFEKYVAMDYGPSMNQTFEIKLNNSGEEVGWDLGRVSRHCGSVGQSGRIFSAGQGS